MGCAVAVPPALVSGEWFFPAAVAVRVSSSSAWKAVMLFPSQDEWTLS